MIYAVALPDTGVFAAWRAATRRAIAHDIPPHQIDWSGTASLFDAQPLPADARPVPFGVPRQFLDLAESVIWHGDPARFALLYQALWRLLRREGDPLAPIDPLGRRLALMAKAVRRDIHKMHAFVRFRELPVRGARRSFAAWFAPDHHSLEPASPFFAQRFADMDWMIATPHRTAHFAQGQLSFTAGAARPDLPDDASEALWHIYFANIFNPARVKLAAMRSEMPRKYWANLPETRLIPAMLADAEARVARMREAGAAVARPGAQQVSTRYRAAMPQPIPLPTTITEARAAAMHCRRCALCEQATQTVWGEGPADAALMIVGEQPGDSEDLAGRPFVGPAGQVLRGLLDGLRAETDRIYLTNAVKHFKFQPRGKRRIHETANRAEIQQCRWWLDREIAIIRPRLIVALGATAAGALTGNDTRISARRGTIEPGPQETPILITWHPAAILRAREPAQKSAAHDQLANDLRRALALCGSVRG